MKTNKILLISPRKSGTHLITSILKFLGIDFKGKLEIGSNEYGFYSVGSTFHSSFNNTFYKLDRESFDGGKLLPLKSSVGIILTRHPLDILYSDINFSFNSDNTAYSNLKFNSDDDKIEHIYNNSFYQNYFFELFNYCAWSRLNNFISISFEELIECVNKKDLHQSPGLTKLIKLLNIKPTDLDQNFLTSSPTFHKGEINLGVEYLSEKFSQIKENEYFLKYCEFYGYDKNKASTPSNLKFLNEAELELEDRRPKNTPILVKRNLEDHNIIYYNRKLYSIPVFINFNKIRKYLKYLKNYKSYEGAKNDCYDKNFLKILKFKIINIVCGF